MQRRLRRLRVEEAKIEHEFAKFRLPPCRAGLPGRQPGWQIFAFSALRFHFRHPRQGEDGEAVASSSMRLARPKIRCVRTIEVVEEVAFEQKKSSRRRMLPGWLARPAGWLASPAAGLADLRLDNASFGKSIASWRVRLKNRSRLGGLRLPGWLAGLATLGLRC